MDEFDVLDAFDVFEMEVKASPRVSVSGLRAVDRMRLESLLALARAELERGQQQPRPPMNWDEALAQAEHERRLLLENAREEANELLREERIKTFTRRRFDQIVEEGQQQAQRIMRDASGSSAERLAEAEDRLNRLHKQVRAGLEILKKGIKESEKSHRQRKREEAKQRKQMH
jgi:hypothetical protein